MTREQTKDILDFLQAIIYRLVGVRGILLVLAIACLVLDRPVDNLIAGLLGTLVPRLEDKTSTR